ncbi:MAG: OB-fold domain-containing protein [Acidimicrobiia bacterium]
MPELVENGALVGGRCSECGRHHFPVLETCPYCAAPGGIERVALPVTGTLWGWTAVTAPPPGYEGEVPFGFGVVELPVGLRIITRITEPDPSKLTFGQTVHLVLGADAPYAFAPGAGPGDAAGAGSEAMP